MAVKKIWSRSETNRARPGWKYDVKTGKYFSYGFQKRRANGKREQVSGFPTKELAENALAKMHLEDLAHKHGITIANSSSPLVSELVEKRLKDIPNKSEKTLATRVLNNWVNLLPANLKVVNVATAHIQLYIDFRTGQILPQTINRELNIIVSTLNRASVYFASLDQWRTPKVPRPKFSQRREERVMSDEEITKLLNYLFSDEKEKGEWTTQVKARHRVGHKLLFALLTGARHGEIDKLRWQDVDFQKNEVKLVSWKTENRVIESARYIPMTAPAREILEKRKELSETQFVFSKSGNTCPSFYRIIRKACEHLGIPYGRYTNGGLLLRHARHTFITNLIQNNTDLETTRQLAGHSRKTMTLYYTHTTKERTAIALENYAAKFQTQVGKI